MVEIDRRRPDRRFIHVRVLRLLLAISYLLMSWATRSKWITNSGLITVSARRGEAL
jgi:hypothetical protein